MESDGRLADWIECAKRRAGVPMPIEQRQKISKTLKQIVVLAKVGGV